MPENIEDILSKAGEIKVSDIILTAGMPPVFMVNGSMRQLGKDPLDGNNIRSLVYGMLEKGQVAKLERDRELDFSISYRNQYRFRGNAFWQRGAVGAVLRLIPTDIPAFDDLGLPPIVKELADTPKGMVLITGPTGHGKSTTLASMIDYINRTRSRHIITVEDPIEFLHTNRKSVIEQREVGIDTNSFASALRHVLRQAPDVILVGEMRDLDTISCALSAAETGHLVLATLHTNDAPQTIDRIIDVFPPHQQNQVRTQLAMVTVGIICQMLLPTADEKSRVLACEILRMTPAVSALIRDQRGQQLAGIIETQGKLGMVSMDSSVKDLYLQGIISEETARKVMKHPGLLFG